VYEARPATCRSYRCQLLKRLQQGEFGEDEARGLIAEARQLEDRVLALLPNGMNIVSARAAFMPPPGNEEQALEWRKNNPQLTLALTMLNRVLDRHFRHSDQRIIAGWDTGMKDAG
jgi:hypothetical protein